MHVRSDTQIFSMMYGRGRGSYLGILLESQSGKTALGAVNDKTEVKVENEVSDDNFSSQKQSGSPLDSAHSQGEVVSLDCFVLCMIL